MFEIALLFQVETRTLKKSIFSFYMQWSKLYMLIIFLSKFRNFYTFNNFINTKVFITNNLFVNAGFINVFINIKFFNNKNIFKQKGNTLHLFRNTRTLLLLQICMLGYINTEE